MSNATFHTHKRTPSDQRPFVVGLGGGGSFYEIASFADKARADALRDELREVVRKHSAD